MPLGNSNHANPVSLCRLHGARAALSDPDLCAARGIGTIHTLAQPSGTPPMECNQPQWSTRQ
jgi:hypothetical protein